MGSNLAAELARCDREEAECMKICLETDGSWWIGVNDWRNERRFFMKEAINELARTCHEANKNWWIDLTTGQRKDRNVGELLMLCVSELSEAMEGHRKNLPDDKLPHRPMLEVELADCLIRIFDLGGGMGLDLGGAFAEKMAYNAQRADHKIENRKQPGGKAY